VIERKIQELYRYEPTNEKGRKKRREDEDVDLDAEDELQMEGDLMNLENPIIDAIILALSVNPLCDEECMGLCPDCGEKWESLPDGHRHEVADARWSGLASLLEKPADFGNQEK
jgi:uncharacterized protein